MRNLSIDSDFEY